MKIQKYAQSLNIIRFITDLFLVLLCWIAAFFVRFDLGLIAMPKGTDNFDTYAMLIPLLIFSYLLVFISTGVYRRSLHRRKVWEEHFDLARSHIFAFFVFVTSTYFLFEHRYSRVTLVLFFCFVPLVLPFGRSFVRKYSRMQLRSGKRTLKALVVGSGSVSREIEDMAQSQPDWAIAEIIAFPASNSEAVADQMIHGQLDVIFVALKPDEGKYLEGILNNLGNTLAEVILVSDFGTPSYLTSQITMLGRLPAVALNASTLDTYGRLTKRAYDILFASCALIALSPIFFILSILVKLSSPGPIFYRQERMGLDGHIFWCLKFRGMRNNAETNTGPVWAKKDDDRTTAIGKLLRKSSLDEIPQFWNVLCGDMSIVGPRPERPVFVQDFRNHIPGYMARHKVKAGITGWAQINGWRGNTSLEKRIECDLWYIQNWSLWVDIKICLLTPFKGFIHPNAY